MANRAASPPRVQAALTDIGEEYYRARENHPPMTGAHGGYAVILEELDELWDAVKADDVLHAKKEAVQVAAMALAFILEVE